MVIGSDSCSQNLYVAQTRSYLCFLSLLQECLLTLLLLALLFSGKVLGLGQLLESRLVQAGDVDFGGCGNHVAGVDSADGNSVDLERTCDEEGTILEVLEKDDTLAAETASEENENGARLQRGPRFGGADGLACLEWNIESVYPSWTDVSGESILMRSGMLVEAGLDLAEEKRLTFLACATSWLGYHLEAFWL